MKILTAAEMREVDRLTTERYRVPSLTLMENAGKSVADFIQARFGDLAQRRIVVLCGKGNNGGDGFVAARHLLKMGAKPDVFLCADPREVKGDAATNLKRWKKASANLVVIRNSTAWHSSRAAVASADIIVDALLGTGLRGPAEGLLAEVIHDINRREPTRMVVAVDIPSGLAADTGEFAAASVRADHTITFTAPKRGMFLRDASGAVGRLTVCDIGSPWGLIEETGKGALRWSEPREFRGFAAPRSAAGHKGDYGHALIVAGSVGKSGAAALAAWAALRVGSGLATAAVPEPVLPIVAAHTPEIMTEPLAATETGSIAFRNFESGRFDAIRKGKQAIGMGPGLSTHPDTQNFVRAVLGARSVPVILDADGLNAFAGRAPELKHRDGALCVTPHPGEMARLLGCTSTDIQARRIERSQRAAADWNACVILKGHHTVTAAPSGLAWINSTGNPGMASGGTGDVLTGMLAGLTAQHGPESWPHLLAWGVYLHGLAGDIAAAYVGEVPLMASDLIRAIPRAFQQFYAESGRA
ncbi:MAG: NAD(P)H-hydrate dehydratase [Acidobacteriia bacterium]|nr:NAD(P)H-hydrate dehydratase [Terriglobia bacterium]